MTSPKSPYQLFLLLTIAAAASSPTNSGGFLICRGCIQRAKRPSPACTAQIAWLCNSLLEALVSCLPRRKAIPKPQSTHCRCPNPPVREVGCAGIRCAVSEEVLLSHTWDEVRRLMWNLRPHRSQQQAPRPSRQAPDHADFLRRDPATITGTSTSRAILSNCATSSLAAELIIDSATQSVRESRGLHYNTDYPERDDLHWLRDTVLAGAQIVTFCNYPNLRL